MGDCLIPKSGPLLLTPQSHKTSHPWVERSSHPFDEQPTEGKEVIHFCVAFQMELPKEQSVLDLNNPDWLCAGNRVSVFIPSLPGVAWTQRWL